MRTFFTEPMESHIIKPSPLTSTCSSPSLALRPWAHVSFYLCCLLILVSSGGRLVLEIKVLKARFLSFLSLGRAGCPEDFHNHTFPMPSCTIIPSMHPTPLIYSLELQGVFASVCILSPTKLSDWVKWAPRLLEFSDSMYFILFIF